MVNERTSMLINPMTCDDINEKVFKHYNYDGVRAHGDLDTIARAESARARLRRTVPLWLGMTAVSGYNCTRLGVLSASGRAGAIGGLAFGAFMTFTTLRV
mmetsp:Transcript_41524/g.54664  ORF Transcript_41524/g.54664 Transcript_41524/m.54664 type:complete len:100 (+) Transcript_41524:32-331(+)